MRCRGCRLHDTDHAAHAGCSSSWPNFSGWVLPRDKSCRSGEARPSRLSQKHCAVARQSQGALAGEGKAQDLRQHARNGRSRSPWACRARVHDADDVVVDQVGSDSGQVVHHGNAQRLQVRAGPMPRPADMRRVDVPPDTITSRLRAPR